VGLGAQHKSHVFGENQSKAIHFITVLTELEDLNPLSLGSGAVLTETAEVLVLCSER
jgi:hypothetical protein